MKKVIGILFVLSVTWAAAAMSKADLDQKITRLLVKFENLQAKPEKRIPPEVLRKAQGLILMNRTKAGFVFAFQGGGGVALVKDKKSGKWGAPAFLQANEGSLGFQIGGQQSFMVVVMMNSQGTRLLTDPTFEFGGEARGTAGDTSAGTEGTIASTERAVLVYDDRQGLFGGAALKGGAISPDEEANRIYYDEPLTLREILFDKKVKPSETATRLSRAITAAAEDKK